MIKAPQLPTGHVIFCDDVRQEIYGKQTLVGTYRNELIIHGSIAAQLPQLCVLPIVRVAPSQFPLTLKIEIAREIEGEREVLHESSVEIPAPPSRSEHEIESEESPFRFAEISTVARLVGLEFTQDCIIRVRAYINGDEYRIGALRVKLTEAMPDLDPQ